MNTSKLYQDSLMNLDFELAKDTVIEEVDAA